ncbi:hypothetical protein F2Q70_00017033 [Brassica cretica]|uniref:Uncharacterized protein n=1 Tax=Brassica cretica TaxID=69181 RepID=A0A8S9L0J5_BRACR|nr:hypothetical protein F2Q70_00017033 [Brassica cretica]KAF2599672.1 hypothetical protein F2Q68_00009981 [Brassica cretica]
MGTQNFTRCESALHLEVEALRWAMENMFQHSPCQSFGTHCKELIAMIKEPHEWPSFATELEKIETLQICFPDFKITHWLFYSGLVIQTTSSLNNSPQILLLQIYVEPVLEQYRPAVVGSLTFSKLTLGTVAPQFTEMDSESEHTIALFDAQREYMDKNAEDAEFDEDLMEPELRLERTLKNFDESVLILRNVKRVK